MIFLAQAPAATLAKAIIENYNKDNSKRWLVNSTSSLFDRWDKFANVDILKKNGSFG